MCFPAWCIAVSCGCASGSGVIDVIYACVVTCGRSFTVLSGWGILISFWSVLMFSLTLLPFYYYYLIITVIVVIIKEVKYTYLR